MLTWKFICNLLIFTGLLMFPVVVFAQPGDPPPVPLTGVEILLGAGAALGVKKYLDRRKNSQS